MPPAYNSPMNNPWNPSNEAWPRTHLCTQNTRRKKKKVIRSSENYVSPKLSRIPRPPPSSLPLIYSLFVMPNIRDVHAIATSPYFHSRVILVRLHIFPFCRGETGSHDPPASSEIFRWRNAEIERGNGAHGLHMYSLLFGRHMGVRECSRFP